MNKQIITIALAIAALVISTTSVQASTGVAPKLLPHVGQTLGKLPALSIPSMAMPSVQPVSSSARKLPGTCVEKTVGKLHVQVGYCR